MTELVARARAVIDRPVDGAWLRAFRFLFGALMAISMIRFIAYGWIDAFFVGPSHHFRYYGFSFIQPLPAPLLHGLFYVLAALAVCIAIGSFTRWASLAFAIGFAYLQLIDVATYLNHYYLAALIAFLLAAAPTGRGKVAAGWLYLFRFQVAVVYTFAGLAKATPDWLLYGQPLGIWLGSHTGMPILGPLFLWEHTAILMSWAGFLFDTSIPWLLMTRRLRLPAYGVVIVFHLLTRVLFPIGMFPFIMVVAALVFFPPEWPRSLLARLGVVHVPRFEAESPARWSRATIAIVALYGLIQLALPLRHLAYPGSVIWNEQGMRFSWRVMVRDKNGSVSYFVRRISDGRVWHVNPASFLTRVQLRELSGQPDLILQLAHDIRDEYEPRVGPVEVRAQALVSLNGRRAVPMIDDTVDLSRVDDSVLDRARWILPEPSVAPTALRSIAAR